MQDLTTAGTKVNTLITKEISRFMHYLTLIGCTMGLSCFILAFLMGYYWIDAILFLIGVIAANVPEGLMAVFTISLSVSASRLAKRNCMIKNLEAVETIGAASIILCDKTGTLTMNQASVAHLWIDNTIGEVDTAADDTPQVTFDPSSSTWKNLARVGVLCSRAEFGSNDNNAGTMRRETIGTPIEAALLRLVEGVEGSTGTFRSMHPKVCEIPFSPIIKFQLSIHECQDFQTNGYLLTTFGDPETILNRCATALVQGHDRTIDDEYRNAFRYACAELGGLGERLVALADWRLPPRRFPPGFQFKNGGNINFPLSGFRLLGLVSMIDPPRPTVPDSIGNGLLCFTLRKNPQKSREIYKIQDSFHFDGFLSLKLKLIFFYSQMPIGRYQSHHDDRRSPGHRQGHCKVCRHSQSRPRPSRTHCSPKTRAILFNHR